MPYIKQERREEAKFTPMTAGELNYSLTTFVLRYLGPHPNYERFNAVIGVLESAKLELYRRAVSPYENQKILENGDVY